MGAVQSVTRRRRRLLSGLIFVLLAMVPIAAFSSVAPSRSEAALGSSSTRHEYDAPSAATNLAAHQRAVALIGRSSLMTVPRSSMPSSGRVLATKGAMRGPKPFGTGAHNLKIKEVADSVQDGQIVAGGQTGLPEQLIRTPGGLRSGRRPDVLVRRPDGSQYGINVGRQGRRTGAPIKREAEAINDLEGAGLEMHYVPYK